MKLRKFILTLLFVFLAAGPIGNLRSLQMDGPGDGEYTIPVCTHARAENDLCHERYTGEYIEEPGNVQRLY